MASETIQIDYAEMEAVANRLQDHATRTEGLRRMLQNNLQNLQSGGWISRDAEKFYQEMDSETLARFQRLSESLLAYADGIQEITQIFQNAEEAASRL